MKIGIPKIDALLGPLEGGDVVLVETLGGLGNAIPLNAVNENKGKVPMVLILPKGSPEIKSYSKSISEDDAQIFVLGKDIDPERLFEFLRIIKGLPKGALIVAIRLDSLFIRRQAKSVHMFLEDLTSTIQERGLVLIMTVEKRSISEKEIAMFENLSTHVIDIIEEISGLRVLHLLRIKKSHKGSTGFYKMEVRDGKVFINETPGFP